MKRAVQLEKAAESVSNDSRKCPRIYQLPPCEGREVLEEAQNQPVCKCPAQVGTTVVRTCHGCVSVFVVKPEKLCSPANVIYYIHGAGWVFGSFHTHEKLVRELAARTGCVVVFPEYTRAPEARFPVAIEQCYEILCRLPELLRGMGLEMHPDTLTVAGDSAGGAMAIDMTLMAKFNRGPKIQKQLLFYPVTNACFDTQSYCEFANDYYLYRDGMKWFWDQYVPCVKDRNHILASPLRADVSQLCGLPEAMIINGQADVLRDEGQAWARKLRSAGVPVTAVQFEGMIHDFVMLNSLDQTMSCRAAMDLSTTWICRMNLVANSKDMC